MCAEDVVHVYPNELKEHVVDGWPDVKCWCEPDEELDDLSDGTVVVHRRMQ